MTYNSNIAALKANIGLRDKDFSRNTKDKINNINAKEKESIKNIQGLTKLLVGDDPTSSFKAGFEKRGNQGQGAIPWAYGGRVRGKKEEAEKALEEDNKRKVEAAAVLQKSLEGLKDQDTEYYKVKRDMLLNGAYYEDADRFTKLSPHAQSFYAQAKLGLYNEKVQPLLTHWLAKAEDQLDVGGMQFTPKDTFGKDSDPLIFKEHAINTGLEEIRRQNGINGFSEEIQLLAGTTGVDGAEQKAKRNLMTKFRKQNAIASSNQRLQELLLEIELDPEGMDFNRALLIASTLIDKNGDPYDNAGALDAIFNQLKSMGVDGSLTDTLLAKIKATPNPIDGTPWGESHKARFEKLESDIEYERKRIFDGLLLKDENDRKAFENQFNNWYEDWERNNPGKSIDQRTLDLWTAKGINSGLFFSEPAYITKIKTAQDSDDQQNIERLTQLYNRQGFITRSDLWGVSAIVKNWAINGPEGGDGKGILVLSEESGKAFGTQYLEESGEGSVPWVIDKLVDGAMGGLKNEQPLKYTRGVTNAKNMFLNSYNNYVTNESYSPEQAKTQALEDIKAALEPQGLLKRESILFAKSEPPGDAYREKRDNSVEFVQKGLLKNGTSEFLQTSAGKLEGTDNELKQALLYLEGKALMPKLYQDIADQFKGISADKLLRWQLIAYGIKTPEEVRVKEPTQNATIALDLDIHRETAELLGFNPTTCTTQQAACLVNYQKNLIKKTQVPRQITSEGGLIDSESGHIAVPSGDENEAQKEASELEQSIDLKAKQEADTATLTDLVTQRLVPGGNIDDQVSTSTSLPEDQEIINKYYGGGVTYATGGTSDNYAKLKYTLAQQLGLLNKYPTSGEVGLVESATGVKQDISNLQPREIDHARVNEIVEQHIMYAQDKTSVQFIGDKEVTPLTGDYRTDMSYTWVQKKIESGEWQLIPILDGKDITAKEAEARYTEPKPLDVPQVGSFLGSEYLLGIPWSRPGIDQVDYRILDLSQATDNDILSQYTVPGSPYLNADLQGYSGQLIAMNLGTNPTVPLTLEAAKTDLDKWNYIVNLAEKSGAKFPELIAAQFMLESARGTKITGTNNYFGLKTIDSDTDSTVLPTQEWEGGKFVTIQAPFKNFESPEAAVEYLAKLWYHDFGEYNGINNAATIEEAAKLLVQEGYATDPAYAKKLLQLIKEFRKLRPRKAITV